MSNTVAGSPPAETTAAQRYLQLGVLVLAGGVIYPLIYLRQNFEVSILESFSISITELSECYAMLGVIFVVTYLPSGWLADRVSSRRLMAFSLGLTGLLGIWFATLPSIDALRVIFMGWGIATGLTFWAALIKAVAVLARATEQGRFFGLLDAGRGLVEAALATLAVAWFAYAMGSSGAAVSASLQGVIYFYVAATLIMVPVVLLSLDDQPEAPTRSAVELRVEGHRDATGSHQGIGQRLDHPRSFREDLGVVLSRREVWLAAICILTGYQLFWATYSFSAYLQQAHGMTAVAVGSITVAKLWMRPIGAAAAGFSGDHFNREKTLGWLLVAASFALAAIVVVPVSAAVTMLLAIVLLIGFLTYAVRGIYWATLESCDVSVRIKGLAIGVISLVGYSPDIYLPLVNAALLERFPGRLGYDIYFSVIALAGLAGAVAAWRLRSYTSQQDQMGG